MKIEAALKTNKFENATHKAVLNVLYTAWYIKTITSRELKEFGLTPEQFNVLRILKGKHPEGVCVKDIAERMLEKSSNVPRIMDRLVLKKLVVTAKANDDGRKTQVQLTKAGLLVLAEANREINKLYKNELALSDKDAKQLELILEKLMD